MKTLTRRVEIILIACLTSAVQMLIEKWKGRFRLKDRMPIFADLGCGLGGVVGGVDRFCDVHLVEPHELPMLEEYDRSAGNLPDPADPQHIENWFVVTYRGEPLAWFRAHLVDNSSDTLYWMGANKYGGNHDLNYGEIRELLVDAMEKYAGPKI